MPTIWIDDKPYEVQSRDNLLQVILSLGLDLPYFCWHPALGSVGACRQCAIKQYRDENDKVGRIVMACMTPVTDGLRISLKDDDSKAFRAMIIETLMTNHPHDCPVCDEGGECHLQDMTVMSGHNYRDYRFTKRTHNNQYLGPFINHEMNRCITCYRCVRYYRDYVGGQDLNAFASKSHVYFGRHEDGALESEFSGNLVEVCPTGVFTDKPFKAHFTRKWDLQTAPSVCAHCAIGCNTIAGERYGELRRILNRYHSEVNGYFLCDRGRFGYGFANSAKRIKEPAAKKADGGFEAKSLDDTQALLKEALKGKVIGIGSPRASLESNYALKKLVGVGNFYSGLNRRESELQALALDILKKTPAKAVSVQEAAKYDAVLILGEDVTNTAPLMALALRQAAKRHPVDLAVKTNIPEWHDAAIREIVQTNRGPFFIAAVSETRLDEVAAECFRAKPCEIANLGYAVAAELSGAAKKPVGASEKVAALAKGIADALRNASKPLVITGTGLGHKGIIQAAANVAAALVAADKPAGIAIALPECNSMGATLMGGAALEDAFEAVKSGKADTVITLENDLARHASASDLAAFRKKLKTLIVLDHTATATAEMADLLLPAGTFAESDGTLVNYEGRAQRFFSVFVPKGEIRESWRWLCEIKGLSEESSKGANLSDVLTGLAADEPSLAAALDAAPEADFRIKGMRVARQPHRYSGRTSMNANISVHEPKPPEDNDAPMSFSMEGYRDQPPPALTNRFWAPGWNSGQSLAKFQQEVGGPLDGGDPGVKLIPNDASAFAYYEPGASCTPPQGCLPAVPLCHIFGSEELSALSEPVAQRIPKAYLAMNSKDAAALGLSEGGCAEVSIGETKAELAVKILDSLPEGLVGLPVGLEGSIAGFNAPAPARIAAKKTPAGKAKGSS